MKYLLALACMAAVGCVPQKSAQSPGAPKPITTPSDKGEGADQEGQKAAVKTPNICNDEAPPVAGKCVPAMGSGEASEGGSEEPSNGSGEDEEEADGGVVGSGDDAIARGRPVRAQYDQILLIKEAVASHSRNVSLEAAVSHLVAMDKEPTNLNPKIRFCGEILMISQRIELATKLSQPLARARADEGLRLVAGLEIFCQEINKHITTASINLDLMYHGLSTTDRGRLNEAISTLSAFKFKREKKDLLSFCEMQKLLPALFESLRAAGKLPKESAQEFTTKVQTAQSTGLCSPAQLEFFSSL